MRGYYRAFLGLFILFALGGNIIRAADSEVAPFGFSPSSLTGSDQCQACDPDSQYYQGGADRIDGFISSEPKTNIDAVNDADDEAKINLGELPGRGDEPPLFTIGEVREVTKQAQSLAWTVTHSLRSSCMEVGVDVNWGGRDRPTEIRTGT